MVQDVNEKHDRNMTKEPFFRTTIIDCITTSGNFQNSKKIIPVIWPLILRCMNLAYESYETYTNIKTYDPS